MTLANLQEYGLEVGTATQEARHSSQVGRIPYRYIPSSCVDDLLSAMDSKTRQAFRAVSNSCRQSVHAYATTLRFESLSVSPTLDSIPIPKCPNVKNLDIYHDYGDVRSFDGYFPASVRSLKVTVTVYEHLCSNALLECTELEELTLYSSEALQETLKLAHSYQLGDLSALRSRNSKAS
eukprot:gene6609-biopygen1801